jgi:hypothetical protein
MSTKTLSSRSSDRNEYTTFNGFEVEQDGWKLGSSHLHAMMHLMEATEDSENVAIWFRTHHQMCSNLVDYWILLQAVVGCHTAQWPRASLSFVNRNTMLIAWHQKRATIICKMLVFAEIDWLHNYANVWWCNHSTRDVPTPFCTFTVLMNAYSFTTSNSTKKVSTGKQRK